MFGPVTNPSTDIEMLISTMAIEPPSPTRQ